MANVIIGGTVECPLCDRKMETISMGKELFYVCKPCMISINALDPALNRWDEIERDPCPKCKAPMRTFYRALDRFTVVVCNTCSLCINIGDEKYMGPKGPVGGGAFVVDVDEEESQ